MLTFDEIALLRRALCEHFELRLEFHPGNKGRAHMVAPNSPRRSINETRQAAELYNKLADLHADA